MVLGNVCSCHLCGKSITDIKDVVLIDFNCRYNLSYTYNHELVTCTDCSFKLRDILNKKITIPSEENI